MVTMLLPGTPVTLYGEELGMEDIVGSKEYPAMSWSNSTNAGMCALEARSILHSILPVI